MPSRRSTHHPGLELDPSARDRFVNPARKVLDQNDAIKAGGEPDGCLDPALAFDDSDYDAAEVAASLRLSELHRRQRRQGRRDIQGHSTVLRGSSGS